jgi:IS30 family transposase
MAHTNYWTGAERDKLLKLADQGLSTEVIALRLGRTTPRISRELLKLRRGSAVKPKGKGVTADGNL